MPTGRPTLYRAEYVDLARKFCLLGATNDDLARMFEVDTSTLERWMNAHEELRASIKEGREEADAHVADRLFKRATGYSHEAVKIVADAKTGSEHIVPYTEHYPPDTTAAIFWLKNRRSDLWRDRHEHTGANGGPIEVITGVPRDGE